MFRSVRVAFEQVLEVVGNRRKIVKNVVIIIRYTAGNFNESASMRAVAKILRVRASEHLCNFCEQFEQKPKFASTFKLDETIRYHYAFM